MIIFFWNSFCDIRTIAWSLTDICILLLKTFTIIYKKIIMCILNHLITNHYVDSWTLFVKKFDWLYNKKQSSRALWCLDFSKFFRLYKFYRFSFLNLICVQSIEFHTWWFYIESRLDNFYRDWESFFSFICSLFFNFLNLNLVFVRKILRYYMLLHVNHNPLRSFVWFPQINPKIY